MNTLSLKKYLSALVIIILVLFNGVTIFLLLQKNKAVSDDNVNSEATVVNTNTTPIDSSQVPTTTETSANIDTTSGSLSIAWSDWPVEVAYYNFFDTQSVETLSKNDTDIKDYYQNSVANYFAGFKIYKVGTVNQGGQFSAAVLYDVIYQDVSGPAWPQMYRVIKDGNRLIVLTKISSAAPYGFGQKIFEINDTLTIGNLGTPESVLIPNSKLVLDRADKEPYRFLTSYDNVEKLFKYDGEHYLYKDNNQGCFLIKAADGTVREYYFNLTFATKAGEPSQYAGATPYVLDVTWNDGSKNSNEYIFKNIGGCGASGCYNYASYLKDVSPLEQIGKTSSGDPVYDLKNISLKANSKDTDSVLKTMYNQYYPGYDSNASKEKPKISFESFLTQRPIIFWQDPFGKFIEFRNAKYLPAVECGKPVIYLYPQQVQDVSVKVKPAGGLTITEPLYRNGWFVKASPDGSIYNYADGKIYPYLFWEGYALNYDRPQEGFVVKQENVKDFLVDSLSKLGLVKNEYDEFIDFWLPKMQAKNYYLISFVPQTEFDKLAPLEVTPKPDTVIRIFMDYQGLDDYANVAAQKLTAPSRNGFTVVEWGGALHR
ncbi:MAG: hypothetical protein PHW95_03685 [Patescibacteria group bacterium]|nr:hypothetical protein [Patescibacteria group bacterium]